jgi:uncharacterized protein
MSYCDRCIPHRTGINFIFFDTCTPFTYFVKLLHPSIFVFQTFLYVFMFPLFIKHASILAFVTSASRQSMNSGSNMVSISSTALRAAAANEPTKKYVLRYCYITDVLEKRGPYREEHLALAKRSCISGGPTASTKDPNTPTGALFIFPDSLSALSFVDKDPYVSAGIVTEMSIEEWTVAIQN